MDKERAMSHPHFGRLLDRFSRTSAASPAPPRPLGLKRRGMILLGASAVACAAVASPVASALAPTPRDGTQHEQPSTARAPNILVIVADDLGYQDVGFNGASFPTPNIDRIADSGRAEQRRVGKGCVSTGRSR